MKKVVKMYKRHGFSLAEVLLTLAIIAVVAIMTIPNLMQEKAKSETVTGYKKAYSTLTNAVKISETQNGEISTWTFPDTRDDTAQATTFMDTYLVPYLNIAKNCGTAAGCWVATKRPDGITAVYSGYTQGIKYILSDGSALSIINYGYTTIPVNVGRLEIMVDINGNKNPNVMGKDVFAFLILQKADPLYNSGQGNLASNVKIGGVYPDGFGIDIKGGNYQYRGCGKDVAYSFAGAYCGMKIIQDGYQIKDDYPW